MASSFVSLWMKSNPSSRKEDATTMVPPRHSSCRNILRNLFCTKGGNSISDIICLPLWSTGISKGIGSREVIFEPLQPSTLSTIVRLEFISLMTLCKNGCQIMAGSRKETSYHTKTIKPIWTNSSVRNTTFSNKSTPR